MNTYDVNFDGFFATEVGRVYNEVKNKILPYLQRERENAKILYSSEKARIEKFGTFVSKFDEACSALNDLVRESKGEIGAQSFSEAVGFRIGDKKIDLDSARSAFVNWAGGMEAATSGIRSAVQSACEHSSEAVKCAAEFDVVFATGIEFWEMALDFYRCDYVFEHAEMKYKMKLCRDFVKFFPLVTQKGDAFLTLCHAEKYDFKQNAELVLQWANEIYEQSQNRLQVYRRIKAMAEDSGMAVAFEEWKQAADYSRKMAQRREDL